MTVNTNFQQSDVLARIKSLLPRWFGDATPILDAVLSGASYMSSVVLQLIAYAQLQTRIATMTDIWLDLCAFDFFGRRFRRRPGEGDNSFRARIVMELLRPRATRDGMVTAIEQLTGTPPIIFEPWSVNDAGAYGAPNIGYGVAGRWGSLAYPNQCLMDVKLPGSVGIPNVPGWGSNPGGYNDAGEWISLEDMTGLVTPADVIATIESVRPVGCTVFLQIDTGYPPPNLRPPGPGFLDETFVLDESRLA